MSKYTGLTPARSRANAKYDAKTYKKILLKLRIDDDADIIEAIQEAKANGINHREWLRELFENQK